jgi:hypothetical protein
MPDLFRHPSCRMRTGRRGRVTAPSKLRPGANRWPSSRVSTSTVQQHHDPRWNSRRDAEAQRGGAPPLVYRCHTRVVGDRRLVPVILSSRGGTSPVATVAVSQSRSTIAASLAGPDRRLLVERRGRAWRRLMPKHPRVRRPDLAHRLPLCDRRRTSARRHLPAPPRRRAAARTPFFPAPRPKVDDAPRHPR